MTDLATTLSERGKTHGEYLDHADITQRIKDVIRSGKTYGETSAHERETLDMIAHKIGRVVSGNPHFPDHWHDIAGYARLSEQRNEAPPAPYVPPIPAAPQGRVINPMPTAAARAMGPAHGRPITPEEARGPDVA